MSPRRPEIPGKPADVRVNVRMTTDMRDEIDKIRADKSRSAYIRSAIRDKIRKENT